MQSLRIGSGIVNQFLQERSRAGASRNTLAAYHYDLALLERTEGTITAEKLTAATVTAFLGSATAPATRKRRLTTIRALVRYLTGEGLLVDDPLAAFDQVRVISALPDILSEDDEIALVLAADADATWSTLAIHLMLHCGLGRGDLLLLYPGDIRLAGAGAVVQVTDDGNPRHPRNRNLQVSPYIFDAYDAYRPHITPGSRIIAVGPPAINSMVERVRLRAGLSASVTPRMLRDTCAANLARNGLGADEMLVYLGMVAESRNRQTMQRLVDHYHAL